MSLRIVTRNARAAGRGLISSVRRVFSTVERPGDLSAVRRQDPYDICVVGAGPAGIIVANDLVQRGFDVLVLESGATSGQFDVSGLDVYRSVGTEEYPLGESRTRAIGGTTDVWTGRCLRLHPVDFEVNSYTPRGNAWPFGYTELEPYYGRAERTLRVRGGRPASFTPPRSSGYPLRADRAAGGLRRLLGRARVEIETTPKSTGLREPGPIRVARDLVPAFRSAAAATLASGATVTRLHVASGGVVEAAETRNLDGHTALARARFYVLACGGIETPRLLLLSAAPLSQRGIGNRYDRVGRCFTEHPSYRSYGRVAHTWRTLSPMYELAYSHQFYGAFKQQGLGGVDLAFTRSWIFPDDITDLRAGRHTKVVRNIARRVPKADLMVAMHFELRPVDDNRVTLEPGLTDQFGNPAAKLAFSYTVDDQRTLKRGQKLVERIFAEVGATDVIEGRRVWGHHHMGTCAAGNDPTTSVVDDDLRVHDSPNLYIVGSSVFVTAGAANPTLTIAALAHRLADHLTSRLRGQHPEE